MDELVRWFTDNGGAFHPHAVLDDKGPFGIAVLAPADALRDDTTIVTCPLALIITRDVASHALAALLGPALDAWSERALIAAYLALHHVCPQTDVLRHLPYVRALPPAKDLLTPLHFTPAERDLLRGTNLHGATLDRERDWRAEWDVCRDLVHRTDPAWADALTWPLYLAAATHLSSRAFPSSILSPTPTLVASPTTHPVLIPGLDLLNHRRAQPVSWLFSPDHIALVAHPTPTPAHPHPRGLVEVFNNYGPKPNDELILGYGFSIPDNPDDTIALLIAGATDRCIVGRHAANADALWAAVRARVADGGGQSEHPFEDDLDTAAVLSDMLHAKLSAIKTLPDVRRSDGVRPAVKLMLEHYIQGQRDILESILSFAQDKRDAAIASASQLGIDLVFDDDDDDDDETT